jgi:hypothetical protein
MCAVEQGSQIGHQEAVTRQETALHVRPQFTILATFNQGVSAATDYFGFWGIPLRSEIDAENNPKRHAERSHDAGNQVARR